MSNSRLDRGRPEMSAARRSYGASSTMMQTLDDLNARVTRALLAAAAAIIFCLGFLVCADIFGRALFNSPVKGTPEIVSMSIVIICFLLAGYAVQSGSMIYTNVFTGYVRRSRRRVRPAPVGIARNPFLRPHRLGQLRAHAAFMDER